MLVGNGWQAGNLDGCPRTGKTAGVLAMGASWSVGVLNSCLRQVVTDSHPLTAKAMASAYPGYTFWWDGRGDADPALVARRRGGTGPHTVVTTDTAEMCAILGPARGRRP